MEPIAISNHLSTLASVISMLFFSGGLLFFAQRAASTARTEARRAEDARDAARAERGGHPPR